MAQKTKKMTLKYWAALSESSKKRALTYVFPLQSEWWQMVFKKVRIPGPGSYYKTVVNNTYLN